MLELNHPQTAHVFAASQQLDLIVDYAKRITLSETKGRKFMLEVVRPAFVALRWLTAERFDGKSTIADGIAELERQLEQLANLPVRDSYKRELPPTECPVCGRRPSEYDPVSYCSSCVELVIPGKERLESAKKGFGIEYT